MQGTAWRVVCCAHAQAGPGLDICGSGSGLEQRRWEWTTVGATTLGNRARGTLLRLRARVRAGHGHSRGSWSGGRARQGRLEAGDLGSVSWWRMAMEAPGGGGGGGG